ncbi:MAG: hypothetical protein A3204_02385 [Candidatus Methanarcanum hacksteinii]|nr:MAG: hypothetical protein A3204_02385 [Candidatus Methanarcanum hacksteinii]
MKSTMKSAFAFIAVALMIMVAVVPMVGVFTEDSSATTTVDPATDDNKITLTVNVKDSAGSNATAGNVKVAYGAYAFYANISAGKATFDIREASVDTLTVSCVDDKNEEIADYPAVTLTNLVAGKTYAATLKAGFINQNVKFGFATGGIIGSLLEKDSTITASYYVYADNEESTEALCNGDMTIGGDSIGTIQVPAGTKSPVYVKIESFGLNGVTFGKQSVVLSGDPQLKAEQSLVTFSTSVMSEITIDSLSVTLGEDNYDDFTIFKNTMIKDDSAKVIVKNPSSGTLKYEASLSANGTSLSGVVLAANGTYAPTKDAFFGTVKMGTYIQDGDLSVKIVDSEGGEIRTVNPSVGADGYFFQFTNFGGKSPSKATDITFTSKDATFKLDDKTFAASNSFIIDGAKAGYKQVAGTLGLDGSSDTIVGKELLITGAKTFGSLVTVAGGKFDFMAEEGKNIIISAADTELYGDISAVPGASSTALKVTMKSQIVTLKVADALGDPITNASVVLNISKTVTQAFEYIEADEVYKATIRGDLTPADYTVTITKDKYTFAKALAFVEGSTYKANEADYTVKFFNDKGEITGIATTSYKIYKATAYKNTLNSIVYTLGEIVSDSLGKYKIAASFLGVKESDIGTEPVDVLVLEKATGLDANGVFKDYYYLLDADDKGVISITASVDSFTGKLVRNDGVTPISGIKVELKTNATTATVADKSYTQKDGSFTLYSDSKIVDGYKVKFEDANGYVFTAGGDAVFKSAVVKNTVFEAVKSAYKITFVDADDAKIASTDLVSAKVGNENTTATTIGNVRTLSAGWTSEMGALAISDVTDRSFIDHTLTAEELASGEITVKSNQKTYTYSVKDANDKTLKNTNLDFYKYVGEIPVSISVVTNTTEQTFLLPVDTDEIDTVYGYVATNGKYAFETAVTKITDVKIDIKSTSAMKTVTLQDAAGVALTVNGTVAIKEDGVEYLPEFLFTGGSFEFVATKDVKYTYTITETDHYSFTATGVSDVNGVVKAKEETITGKVTDAAGKYFDIDVNIDVYFASGPTMSTIQNADDASFSIIAEKSKIAYYKASVTGNTFTFKDSKTADIKAVETFVPITFASANGIAVDDLSGYTVNVINKLGIQSDLSVATVNKTKGVVLDTTDVVSYSVTITGTNAYFPAGTYTSVNGAFVSDVAEYKGKLGATYATGDVLEYAVYKGNELVLRGNIEVGADKTAYNAKVNKALGDKVIITFKKGADVYTAVMNDNVAYNDLVKVVVAPSLKASITFNEEYAKYVDYELSADKTKVYLIANESYSVDATSSTGEKLVEKFVFDGWYVNGEKVSSKLNYTVDNVDSNVIMANYVSDGYYEIDKPVQNDNGVSPTVLVIGIAAVIVALIAVVYTVIQKKE